MIRKTITISRQMGTGGSYIGQVIATHLGLKYVDREVLHQAAKEFGCDEETVAARSERISSFWSVSWAAYRWEARTRITTRHRCALFLTVNYLKSRSKFSNE